MSHPERYHGPARRGRNRPLTAAEQRTWQYAARHWHTEPPWTAQVEDDNALVKRMLVQFYEDGVALAALAASAGWGLDRVAGILHRCREEGLTSGTRRYIPAPRVVKEPVRRSLSEDEVRTLRAQYVALTSASTGGRAWRSEAAGPLLATLDGLTKDKVSMGALGEALGVTRQAVHQHLSRYRAQQASAQPMAQDTAA